MHGEGIQYANGFWSLLRRWGKDDGHHTRHKEMIRTSGDEYKKYLEKVPMFVPQIIQRDSAENRSF